MGNLAILQKKAAEVGGGLEPLSTAASPSGNCGVGFVFVPASGVLHGCSLAVPGKAPHCCIAEKHGPAKGCFCREYK